MLVCDNLLLYTIRFLAINILSLTYSLSFPLCSSPRPPISSSFHCTNEFHSYSIVVIENLAADSLWQNNAEFIRTSRSCRYHKCLWPFTLFYFPWAASQPLITDGLIYQPCGPITICQHFLLHIAFIFSWANGFCYSEIYLEYLKELRNCQ